MTTEIATNTAATANNQQDAKQQQQIDKNNNDNTNATNTDELDLVPIDKDKMKYPLENSWSFWFFKNDKNKDWKDNLVFITNVEFVEDFWAVYNHLQPVNRLTPGSDYMFFKKDIQPMWEDQENRDGGRWLLSLDKQMKGPLDGYWLNTLLALIGDQFMDESPYVNGAVISIRPKGNKIALWTKAAKDHDLQRRIGRKFQEFLQLRDDLITYEAHADPQKVNLQLKGLNN